MALKVKAQEKLVKFIAWYLVIRMQRYEENRKLTRK